MSIYTYFYFPYITSQIFRPNKYFIIQILFISIYLVSDNRQYNRPENDSRRRNKWKRKNKICSFEAWFSRKSSWKMCWVRVHSARPRLSGFHCSRFLIIVNNFRRPERRGHRLKESAYCSRILLTRKPLKVMSVLLHI